MATATHVVLSYPADLSDWGRNRVERSAFKAYLRRVKDRASEGTAWPEFVGVGCCGDALDVPLRVESIEGGDRIDDATTFSFVERAACGIEGGWRVQSAAGPTE